MGSPRRSLWRRFLRFETAARFPGTRLSIEDRIPNGNIIVGEGTYGSPTIRVFGSGNRVSIGRYCSIGEGVLILAGGDHDLTRPSLYPFRSMGIGMDVDAVSKGPVSIGHDVWIGARATVLSGVSIGNGAVVGAGAVVAKDVPAFGIAVGCPARVVRYRFGDDHQEALEQIAWWNWPSELIEDRVNDFYLPVAEFILMYGTRR